MTSYFLVKLYLRVNFHCIKRRDCLRSNDGIIVAPESLSTSWRMRQTNIQSTAFQRSYALKISKKNYCIRTPTFPRGICKLASTTWMGCAPSNEEKSIKFSLKKGRPPRQHAKQLTCSSPSPPSKSPVLALWPASSIPVELCSIRHSPMRPGCWQHTALAAASATSRSL